MGGLKSCTYCDSPLSMKLMLASGPWRCTAVGLGICSLSPGVLIISAPLLAVVFLVYAHLLEEGRHHWKCNTTNRLVCVCIYNNNPIKQAHLSYPHIAEMWEEGWSIEGIVGCRRPPCHSRPEQHLSQKSSNSQLSFPVTGQEQARGRLKTTGRQLVNFQQLP